MPKYSYKHENGTFRLYEDANPISTPHGNPVVSETEDLAAELVKALENGEDYTMPGSILTYHYTYCNNLADGGASKLSEEFANGVNYDILLYDPYLMFRQPGPVKQAVASYMETEMSALFRLLNLYQLTAISVVYCVDQSLMLSYYIIGDICNKLQADENADYETLREEFMADLKDFQCEEFGYDPSEADYSKYLDETRQMIDTFVHYYNL